MAPGWNTVGVFFCTLHHHLLNAHVKWISCSLWNSNGGPSYTYPYSNVMHATSYSFLQLLFSTFKPMQCRHVCFAKCGIHGQQGCFFDCHQCSKLFGFRAHITNFCMWVELANCDSEENFVFKALVCRVALSTFVHCKLSALHTCLPFLFFLCLPMQKLKLQILQLCLSDLLEHIIIPHCGWTRYHPTFVTFQFHPEVRKWRTEECTG